jgi:Luciferase
MSVREELEQELARIPGLVRRPSRWGREHAYFVGDREIAHFHKDGRMDVRLTKELIRERKVEHALDERVHTRGPSAEWASVTLSTPTDLPLAISLVEEAMRANA